MVVQQSLWIIWRFEWKSREMFVFSMVMVVSCHTLNECTCSLILVIGIGNKCYINICSINCYIVASIL